ncbi:ATP-binding protein [Litorisediminicola beolgyonensis]|uniref:ATP-binding protein n=1 Tax=Litorisediminicola beolgyonensis TaxID=1173614 RepID=A0ABW3ZGC3_9RHOB
MSPEIREFLAALGLVDVVGKLEAEDIDEELFWHLEERDLKEIGLTLGQRKKLIRALSDRAKEAGDVRAEPTPAPATGGGLSLRRLTVLFSDLVGSTELGSHLSAEDMHDLLQLYYQAARRVARRFGGYITSLQGDGVVVLFGYPKTLTANAERAIAAGLALQAELQRLAATSGPVPKLQARIGVASGTAVVGLEETALGGDRVQLVGSVVNRAARLQTVAEPGAVVADDQTRVQSDRRFRFARLPDASLKGFERPVPVSRAMGERRSGNEIDREAELRPLGRDAIQARLSAALSDAASGKGSLVFVHGEAGIGKTTALTALARTASEQEIDAIHLACASMASNTALRPVLDRLSEALGSSGPEGLDALLPEVEPAARDSVARALGYEIEGPAPAAARERAQLLEALTHWLLGSGCKTRLLMVEDLHWADPTTIELLAQLAKRLENRSCACVVTSRMEPPDSLTEAGALRVEPLAPLAADGAEALLARRLGATALPESLRDRILEKSGGNPLMIDTLARAARSWSDADLTRGVAVPDSIYESLAAQVDTLDAGRAVAAMLSVIDGGAEIGFLAELLDIPLVDLADALEELRALGVVPLTHGESHANVRFRHSLYRDVIYERLLSPERRALHAAVFDGLRRRDPEVETQRPDLLAQHAMGAELWAEAAPLSIAAAERGLAGSALIEAGAYLDQAEAALGKLEKTRETDRLRLRALGAMASLKRAREGIASDAAGRLAREILALARELGETKTELAAYFGIYSHALVKADYRAADDWSGKLMQAARERGDPIFMMVGTRAVGSVALHTGRPERARDLLQQALAEYDIDKHAYLAHQHGYDHAEIASVFLAKAQWLCGDLEAAQDVSKFAVAHSRRIGHAHSLAQALAFRAMLGGLSRDGGPMAEAGDEAYEIGKRYELPVMRDAGLYFAAAARLLSRDAPVTVEDVDHLQELSRGFRAVNPYNYGPLSSSFLASAMLRAGLVEDAHDELDHGERVQERTGEAWTSSELLRLRARAFDAEGAAAKAREARTLAYKHASDQGAVTLALRVACDMAERDGDLSRVAQDMAKLASQDESWDLRRARAVLDAAVTD